MAQVAGQHVTIGEVGHAWSGEGDRAGVRGGRHHGQYRVSGPIDTVRDWLHDAHQPRERSTAKISLGRYGHVDAIAGACRFLASAAGGLVSGQALQVDGGHNMY